MTYAPGDHIAIRDVLDVVIAPDRHTWSWKDEEAFEEARTAGELDPATATLARTTGLEQAERALAGESPFEDHWLDWRPDPAWHVPTLASGVQAHDSDASRNDSQPAPT